MTKAKKKIKTKKSKTTIHNPKHWRMYLCRLIATCKQQFYYRNGFVVHFYLNWSSFRYKNK